MDAAAPPRTERFVLKPWRITVCYAVFGLAWIFGTDWLTGDMFADDPSTLLWVSIAKGVGFVLVTALLLFFLLHRHVRAYRRTELELRRSWERYRQVVENAPDAILVHDGASIVYANVAAARLLGFLSPEQLKGRAVLDCVHESSRQVAIERIRRNIEGRQPAPLLEQRYQRQDGTPVDVEVAAVPLDLDDVPAALAFLRDISARKAAEESLKRSEAKYRVLADNAHDVIYTMDPDLRLTYVSPSVERLRGISPEQALKEPLEEAMTPASAAKWAVQAKRMAGGAALGQQFLERMELELRRRDGSTVWVESVVRPYYDGERFLGFIGVSRDVTDRCLAEEERRRSEQFLALILDAIPDPVFVKNSSHRFVMVNGALCAMLGVPPETVIGKEDGDFVAEEEARVFIARDNLVLETGQEDLYEEQLTDKSGEVHILVTRKGLFVDPAGARYIVGVIRDVTENKANERRLRQSLQEKEVLLKEVHHRVKNNLQVISSLLFLQKDAIEDPAIQELFEESRNRITSMALIHEELYRSGDLARVDVKDYLERLTPKVVQSLRGVKSIGFSLSLAECHLTVDKAIPFGLIVNELVTNAVKHGFTGRDSGNVRLTVAREDDLVRVTVEDDGVGLPEGFHPDAVKSLGMQLVVQLTRQLRGGLSFGSGALGTTFRLSFPVEDPQSV